METCKVDGVLYNLPASVDEVEQLVKQAKDQHLRIVVRGAGHSFPLIRDMEAPGRSPAGGAAPPPTCLYIMLSKLNAVTIDHSRGQVTVQAGCHLGYDPFDPTGISTLENSLVYQLDPIDNKGNRANLSGWSLPDLGGITHQTIGGFMATGSSGGSVKYAFEDAIVALEVVYYGLLDKTADTDPDAYGVVRKTFCRPAGTDIQALNDPFFAIGFANMGLMGIVTSVTLQCGPALTLPDGSAAWTFDIVGSEATTTLEECAIDLFGDGEGNKPTFRQFLEQTDYTRLIWWPQKDKEPEAGSAKIIETERMVVWQASRVAPVLAGSQVYKPYEEVPYLLGSPALATLGADLIYTAIGQWPTWLENTFGENSALTNLVKQTVSTYKDPLFQLFLNTFVQLDKAKVPPGAQHFNDIWWRGIPMDNQMSDTLFPVWFTELWIPIEHTQLVMKSLHDFYRELPAPGEPDHAGHFCCEIYAARKSNFWMSPAFQADVIRIDVFWFGNNRGVPERYYQLFWDRLSQFNFRPHWGKYLPDPAGKQGVHYLKARYPKWEQWMDLRRQIDPFELFVSDYWRNHLAISGSTLPAPAPQPNIPTPAADPVPFATIYDPVTQLYHPRTENEIVELVRYAVDHNLQVRVRGAAQSVAQGIFTDDFRPDNNGAGKSLNLELDQLRQLTFDDATCQVTVGAGCNLGFDPYDPADKSTPENGLFPQLEKKGWVFPAVPSVVHQTVAGYMATGSSGGSLTHSFDEYVVAVRLVDGTGKVCTFCRGTNPDDDFFALGSSMGLLGVFVSVTLQCLPALNNQDYQSSVVVGRQTITPQTQCEFMFPVPDGSQKPSLEAFLKQHDFARLMWWPYKSLEWVVTWQANAMSKDDIPFVERGPSPFKPPFPDIAGSRLVAQIIAAEGYWLIDNWPDWFLNLTKNLNGDPNSQTIGFVRQMIELAFPKFYEYLISWYFNPQQPPQHFWDVWWKALAMDSVEFSNNLFSLSYTELWVPLAQTDDLLRILNDFYASGGIAATGTYTVELLGARKSDFWLSPSYGQDVIRLNILYFSNGNEPPEAYFSQFWKLLHANGLNFRPHWGKMLPPAEGPTGAAYLQSQYEKWKDFAALRSRMDPHNVFLTDYWKKHLGL